MSYFINSENQNLLWTIINKTDGFKRTFYPGSPNDQNIWFRNIIQQFYQEIQPINKEELTTFNRKVITYMLDNLKPINQQPPIIDRKPYYVENKEEIYQRQFMERQQQYDSLLSKPAPPKPDFGDNIKDEAISNMEELMETQKKMREEEIKSILPPPDIVPDSVVKPISQNSSEIDELKTEIANINIKLSRMEEEIRKSTELIKTLSDVALHTFTLKNI
jgi:hypothetical protein